MPKIYLTRKWVIRSRMMSMKTCMFFGHRIVPRIAETNLRKAISRLIEEEDVQLFLVGDKGGFDKMVQRILEDFKRTFPCIRYGVVVESEHERERISDFANIILPKGLENIPRKDVETYHNRWLVQRSDYAVVYVNKSFGKSAKFMDMAEMQGLKVINIAKLKPRR